MRRQFSWQITHCMSMQRQQRTSDWTAREHGRARTASERSYVMAIKRREGGALAEERQRPLQLCLKELRR